LIDLRIGLAGAHIGAGVPLSAAAFFSYDRAHHTWRQDQGGLRQFQA
jgi:hypothetical protein